MSDTTELLTEQDVEAAGTAPGRTRRRSGGGLTGMLLPELQQLAGELGITGTARMRKSDLIAAIKARQGSGGGQDTLPVGDESVAESKASTDTASTTDGTRRRGRRAASRPAGAAAEGETAGASASEERAARTAPAPRSAPAPRDGVDKNSADKSGADKNSTEKNGADRSGGERAVAAQDTTTETTATTGGQRRGRDRGENNRDQNREGRGEGRSGGRDRQQSNDRQQSGDRQSHDRTSQSDDDSGDGNRRRPRRFRDRNRRGRDRGERFEGSNNSGSGSSGNSGSGSGGNEPDVREDDVLIPVAGIVDILDNYAFVRTTGYLTGPTDVYVSLSQVRRNGLRRGDHVTGAVRQPREGERRDKYNALVRLDSVNGLDVEQSKNRPEFHKLTPLYPQDRLRLETEPHVLTTRVIDLVMPIGKGQRALIVSPPKAGKTMVLQSIANAITTNNPECYLMVVLVDERPEEVTDMTRSVKGEVIASTFDRPPSDHTSVAELSIDRAKRLVELGHDVVVLLDSITRLGRAYNNASPASGRILSGGIDSTALYPPKRFLGAARNIENGGSLTIIATALVETGSTGDTVIFEEFKGTGNAELKLDRKIADKRIFPAVDVDASSTRKEEILLSPDELGIVIKLRRVLHALDQQQAIELVLDQLKKTKTNVEFLMQIQKTTPGAFGAE